MVGRQAAAVGLDHLGAVGDGEQRVMRLVHALVGKEDVVGGDERNVPRVSEIEDLRLEPQLVVHVVALQLDIEPVAEGLLQQIEAGQRGIFLAGQQQTSDRTVGRADQGDQALRHRRQFAERHLRRFARHAFEIGAAEQFDEIGIARRALRQHHHLVRIGCAADRRARPRRLTVVALDRQFAADDRLHADIGDGRGEFIGAEQVAAVGHRHGRHRVFLAKLGEVVILQRAFQ